ncbi:thiamine biosynthesis protein ThiF [Aphanothece hegewaldii CCALA 016]|uniref:Thiamine biosynthesis protein ThiF n=2 Tax=Aphanothece TaxID=1121 RepID=A0A2T1LRP9_9CHRO|nr:thiamine biosynthesis protein ThiF [Aphanothece hegewaldii CCALA 016]
MTNEQFEQIVEAILDGKYSWACVLILRSAGYNPLHYIPYRTYNRLIKDNCLNHKPSESGIPHPTADARSQDQSKQVDSFSTNEQKNVDFCLSEHSLKKIEDLKVIKELDEQAQEIKGGYCRWFS